MAYLTILYPGAFHTKPYFTRTTFQVKLSEMASLSPGLAQNAILEISKCLENEFGLNPELPAASRIHYSLS
jgi:hypothetical protein